MHKQDIRTRRRLQRIYRNMRDRSRGYSVSRKVLGIAVGVELTIIGSSFFASYQFAERYALEPVPTEVAGLMSVLPGMGHGLAWWMAIIMGLTLATAELVRLPLVASMRTHKSFPIRTLSFIGVILCCMLTTKAMAIVCEQVYSQRLHEVRVADGHLKNEEALLEKVSAEKDAAVANAAPANENVARLDRQIEELNHSLQGIGKPPPDRKVVTNKKATCLGKDGKAFKCTKSVTTYVPVPWEGKALVAQLQERNAERDRLTAESGEKSNAIADTDVRIADQRKSVAAAETERRNAIDRSQIHSFAGMWFSKSADDVTDDEVYAFLRVFVLIPSVMIAVASSLLAMSAYTILPKLRKPKVKPETKRRIVYGEPFVLEGAKS